ncbi:unnamed protein product [Meganyctiphanes norvegica]|uniref:Solute carrier family 13 member 5 n=1 Tax=Meganyctiphanes norvegica TaxID=48144 RepID=A0AAV2S6T8_MEGNR
MVSIRDPVQLGKMFSINYVFTFWKALVILIPPLLLALLPILMPSSEIRCAYVIAVMAVYWMTEAIPMSVTALIPIFAFPLLGVMSTQETCIVYLNRTNMLFLGGLMVAVAVEHCNLHKRIALLVILHVGQSPRRLMGGFMFTAMFLSMWISNTATCAMMVPIVYAILQEVYRTHQQKSLQDPLKDTLLPSNLNERENENTNACALETGLDIEAMELENKVQDNAETEDLQPPNDECRAIRDMCFISVACASNIGGTGCLTGTGPNLVLNGILQGSFSEPTGLNFATWLLFNVPPMLICTFLSWLWLQALFLGVGKNARGHLNTEEAKSMKRMIRKKFDELGKMSYQEGTVLVLFILLVFLWMFRAPEFMPGWAKIFKDYFGKSVSDATPVMFVVFLLFILPARLPNCLCFRDPNDSSPPTSSPACLTWQAIHEKLPWGVIILLGGGFAMAKAAQTSGLSLWLGELLKTLGSIDKVGIMFIVCIMAACVSNVASNTATASIFLPVIKDLSLGLEINPLYLMLSVTIVCSYAFILPVATPPNAIVFNASGMKTKEMMRAGVVMNIVCLLVIIIFVNTLGVVMFDLNDFPAWTNSTI